MSSPQSSTHHDEVKNKETSIPLPPINEECGGPYDDGTCAGYLDTVLTVFAKHKHPFVLVGTAATRWNACKGVARELDVLLCSSQMQAIVDDLVASEQWVACHGRPAYADSVLWGNETAIKDIWLEARFADTPETYLGFAHLRFWPEELYQLSVDDCQEIEVPDALALNAVQLEEEYHRDPSGRFGPTLTKVIHARGHSLTPEPKYHARSLSHQHFPIFIPTVQSHLNSLLDQHRTEEATGLSIGNAACKHLKNYIRYNMFDWPPARDWLMRSGRIEARNAKLMEEWMRKYRRKPAFSWDEAVGDFVFIDNFFEAVLRPDLESEHGS
ncbi:hypothetical protein MMC19_003448 [Ptychographa xylographoides]|nr:hypothetical protein [Ptychographa xylographoides]